jgi:nucleoside-diphosphate-sugar epimerase
MNVGNPEEFTVLEVARLVLEITGSSSDIVFEPLPPTDPVRRCPDITLAKRELGWVPRVPMRDGLLRTLEWYREHRSG